jgi:hypothetical protein
MTDFTLGVPGTAPKLSEELAKAQAETRKPRRGGRWFWPVLRDGGASPVRGEWTSSTVRRETWPSFGSSSNRPGAIPGLGAGRLRCHHPHRTANAVGPSHPRPGDAVPGPARQRAVAPADPDRTDRRPERTSRVRRHRLLPRSSPSPTTTWPWRSTWCGPGWSYRLNADLKTTPTTNSRPTSPTTPSPRTPLHLVVRLRLGPSPAWPTVSARSVTTIGCTRRRGWPRLAEPRFL